MCHMYGNWRGYFKWPAGWWEFTEGDEDSKKIETQRKIIASVSDENEVSQENDRKRGEKLLKIIGYYRGLVF